MCAVNSMCIQCLKCLKPDKSCQHNVLAQDRNQSRKKKKKNDLTVSAAFKKPKMLRVAAFGTDPKIEFAFQVLKQIKKTPKTKTIPNSFCVPSRQNMSAGIETSFRYDRFDSRAQAILSLVTMGFIKFICILNRLYKK